MFLSYKKKKIFPKENPDTQNNYWVVSICNSMPHRNLQSNDILHMVKALMQTFIFPTEIPLSAILSTTVIKPLHLFHKIPRRYASHTVDCFNHALRFVFTDLTARVLFLKQPGV